MESIYRAILYELFIRTNWQQYFSTTGMPFRSISYESLQWFLITNTAHLFGFTTYTHMKLHVTSLKRLQDAHDWFILSAHFFFFSAPSFFSALDSNLIFKIWKRTTTHFKFFICNNNKNQALVNSGWRLNQLSLQERWSPA
jgi:hypothetical protein